MQRCTFKLNIIREKSTYIEQHLHRFINTEGVIYQESSWGACFFLKHKNKIRLYTAKHIINVNSLVSLTIETPVGTINLPLLHQWNLVSTDDIAYIECDKLVEPTANFFSQNCFSLYSESTLSPPEKYLMEGFPIITMGVFRRSTALATTEKNGNILYTDDPSIQGFSGGPLIVVTNLINGRKLETVIGVVAGTFNDDTGGKLGIIISINYVH